MYRGLNLMARFDSEGGGKYGAEGTPLLVVKGGEEDALTKQASSSKDPPLSPCTEAWTVVRLSVPIALAKATRQVPPISGC